MFTNLYPTAIYHQNKCTHAVTDAGRGVSDSTTETYKSVLHLMKKNTDCV